MREITDTNQRNLFIYQIYVRNHTKAGTFNALLDDLDRIKAMGVDMIYLLPVHPIGKKQRKGTLGSPYAIKDYFAINEEHGDMKDFETLIETAHKKGLKVMMDIVFNHTSPDSVLLEKHPEFFYKKNGHFTNRIGEWWDVIDFDYNKDKKLWTYLIDVLAFYTKKGIDGFRFDVASLLPYDFLAEAKQAIQKLNPNTIWLSESVHGHFLKEVRDRGFEGLSEAELFSIFDLAYDYDAHPYLEAYLKDEGPLSDYTDWLMKQEEIYPKDYIKMRHLENHDFGRIAGYLNRDEKKLDQWYAFNFFNKGATMIFSGSEAYQPHHPSLFDKDTIDFSPSDKHAYFTKLHQLTTGKIFSEGTYQVRSINDAVIEATYEDETTRVIGIFNVGNSTSMLGVELPDGNYKNALDHKSYPVNDGKIKAVNTPLIITINKEN